MTSINGVSQSQNITGVHADQVQSQRAFTEQGSDKVEVSKKNKIKKAGVAMAITGVVTTGASLLYLIGRNPARAAKVLNGNENIVNKAYSKGKKIADEIMAKEGSFKTTVDKIFEEPKYKSELSKHIEELENYIQKNNLSEESGIVKATKRLKQNLEVHLSQAKQKLNAGETLNIEMGKDFVNKNRNDINTIYKYFEKEPSFDAQMIGMRFAPEGMEYSVGFADHLRECPKDILPQNGVFYHGTPNSKKVYESGFTPFVSKQLEQAPRELGAGIYATPDAGVAAYFSGLQGRIIPVKMSDGSRIAIMTENAYSAANRNISQFMAERISPEEFQKYPKDLQHAINECVVRNIYKQAGYDAVYIPKGVKGGGGLFDISALLSPDINEVIGRKQSQLVIFSPEKLTVAPRTFKERLGDLKLKFEGLKAQLKYQKEHPLGF